MKAKRIKKDKPKQKQFTVLVDLDLFTRANAKRKDTWANIARQMLLSVEKKGEL